MGENLGMEKKYLNTVIKNNTQSQSKEGILWAWQNQHPTIKWWLVLSSICYVLGTVFLMINM
jgi:hypothetical protein